MKMQTKPIIALASGAVLIAGVVGQTVRAQEIVPGPQPQAVVIPLQTATLAEVGGPGPNITVSYEVTQDVGPDNLFNYYYDVNNPGGNPATVGSLDVAFDSTVLGSVVGPVQPNPPTGVVLFGASTDSTSGVQWFFSGVAPGTISGTLGFQSAFPPTLGTANATGAPSAPPTWASIPNGQDVPVPSPTPEPATTALFALGSLAMAFRKNFLKKA